MEVIVYARLNIVVEQLMGSSELTQNSWLPHFNKRDYEGEWEVLPLRSPGGRADLGIPDLMGNDEYLDTVHMLNFPGVKKLLDALQCPVMSARFLNLKAGAVIKEHRDRELAFEKGEARLHFPVLTNDNVEFYVNNTRLNMQPGESWYINANLPHRVTNNGSTDRIHLVVDCKVNEWLTSIFASAEKQTYQEDKTAEKLQIIKQLRMQNTQITNELADKIEWELKSAINL